MRLHSNTVLRTEASLSLNSNSLRLFYATHVLRASCNLAANNGNINEMNDLNPSLHAVLPDFATRKAEGGRNDLTINDSGSLEHLGLYVESAMCGDPIVDHCLATGVDTKPEESEPNTIKQAYALPDRAKWREEVDNEMSMIEQFRVFSFPMPLPP